MIIEAEEYNADDINLLLAQIYYKFETFTHGMSLNMVRDIMGLGSERYKAFINLFDNDKDFKASVLRSSLWDYDMSLYNAKVFNEYIADVYKQYDILVYFNPDRIPAFVSYINKDDLRRIFHIANDIYEFRVLLKRFSKKVNT